MTTTPPPPGRVRVLLHAANGQRYWWRKQERVHTLAPELGPVWVANFRPALFQVAPDGTLVPRGTDPQAVDVVQVELRPAPEPGQPEPEPR